MPYLLWGTIYGTLVMTPILMSVNRAHGVELCQGTVLHDFSTWNFVNGICGLSLTSPPNGALWYVRLCLIFFLFAPVLRFIRRHAKLILPCAALLCILYGNPFVVGYKAESVVVFGEKVRFSLLGVGYLFLGMSASIFRIEKIRVVLGAVVLMFLVWCVWTYVTIESCLGVFQISQVVVLWNHKVSGLLLMGVLWGMVDLVPTCVSRIRPEVAGLSFWIYCMHHPVTAYVGGGLHAVLGRSLQAEVGRMFLAAPITLVVCIASGLLIKKFPSVYSLLTGGRAKT